MTTLELARLVAETARASTPADAAVDVLEILDRNGCWFCRVTDAHGVTIDAPLRRARRRRATPLRLKFGAPGEIEP